MCLSHFSRRPLKVDNLTTRGLPSCITNGNGFTRLFLIHFQNNVNICGLNVDVVNLKSKFIYLGRSPRPLLTPDVLADVDVVILSYLLTQSS
jgi:hypothetical protein